MTSTLQNDGAGSGWTVSDAKSVEGYAWVVNGEEGHDFGLVAEVILPENAPVIAAAPELLEAVRLFLFYDANDDADGTGIMLDYVTALDAAKEAYAKATAKP